MRVVWKIDWSSKSDDEEEETWFAWISDNYD